MEVGYADTIARRDEIEEFFFGAPPKKAQAEDRPALGVRARPSPPRSAANSRVQQGTNPGSLERFQRPWCHNPAAGRGYPAVNTGYACGMSHAKSHTLMGANVARDRVSSR